MRMAAYAVLLLGLVAVPHVHRKPSPQAELGRASHGIIERVLSRYPEVLPFSSGFLAEPQREPPGSDTQRTPTGRGPDALGSMMLRPHGQEPDPGAEPGYLTQPRVRLPSVIFPPRDTWTRPGNADMLGTARASDVLEWGGRRRSREEEGTEPEGQYLGDLGGNRYNPNSTLNPYGSHGSRYSGESVNNPYGRYGSPYSSDSANNPYTIGGPKIYGRDGKYLGRLNSNRYDAESVSNPYGRHGSRYSPDSINNPYGRYGSRYSGLSPNNPYTTTPPRLFGD